MRKELPGILRPNPKDTLWRYLSFLVFVQAHGDPVDQ